MIHLLPIGKASPQTLEGLASSLKEVFAIPAVIHEPVSLSASSYDPARYQYHSTLILNSLSRFKSSLTQVERVLGVADVNLYAADLNFVFVEADPKEGVAVISIARLRQEFYGYPPDEKIFQERTLKETVHELGYTYGLGHCSDSTCVIHFSNSLEDTDKKNWGFFKKCNALQRQ